MLKTLKFSEFGPEISRNMAISHLNTIIESLSGMNQMYIIH